MGAILLSQETKHVIVDPELCKLSVNRIEGCECKVSMRLVISESTLVDEFNFFNLSNTLVNVK